MLRVNKLLTVLVSLGLLVAGLLSSVVGEPAVPAGVGDGLLGDVVQLSGGGAVGSVEGRGSIELESGERSLTVEAFPLEDTWIYEWEPATNYGSLGGFRVRPSGGIASALLRWDLSSVPVGAVIRSARLELYCTYRDRAARVDISAFKVLVPWQESSATWTQASNGVPWAQAGCRAVGVDRAGTAAATRAILATDAIPAWYAWTITSLVQEWVDAPASNYGLILVGAGSTVSYDFFSSEGNPTFRPRLIVEYQVPVATATPTSLSPTGTTTPSATATAGPSLTPTEASTSWIDISRAIPAYCMGTFSGDTTGKPNNAQRYGDLPWPETGPEDVYILTKTVVSDLTVVLEDPPGVDHDLFLLGGPYPSALLKAHDSRIFYPSLPPGTYYIVVDGFEGSMGPYRLTVYCEGEPTPTATSTPRPTATNTPAHGYLVLLYKMPTPTPTRTPTPTVTPTPLPYQVGVNCGGREYQASDGLLYQPDQPYAPGSWGWVGGQAGFVTTTNQPISNTIDDPLYQSQRYAMSAYRFSVPAGHYEVLLRFAEIFPYVKPGQRVFSVYLEGQRVMERVDTVGQWGRYRAWDGKYCIEVNDGTLDITFENHTTEYAAVINAIRVTRLERCP